MRVLSFNASCVDLSHVLTVPEAVSTIKRWRDVGRKAYYVADSFTLKEFHTTTWYAEWLAMWPK